MILNVLTSSRLLSQRALVVVPVPPRPPMLTSWPVISCAVDYQDPPWRALPAAGNVWADHHLPSVLPKPWERLLGAHGDWMRALAGQCMLAWSRTGSCTSLWRGPAGSSCFTRQWRSSPS